MKRKVFSLMMGLVLAFTGLVRANELTVNDGTQTQRYTPVYTYYGDTQGSAAQFVVPADQITVMNGAQITSMRFYINPAQNYQIENLGGPTYAGYMTEVSGTTMSSFIDFGTATQIFNGHLSPLTNNGTELVIDFATPYTYNGGNLAIAFTCTQSSGYCSVYYYSVAATGGSIYRNSSSASGTVQNYLPKTTFTYEGGSPAPVAGLHVVDAEGRIDTINMGPRPSGAWMRPYEFTMTYDGTAPIAVSVLDFTPNDGYFTMVDVEYPIEFRHNDEVGLAIATGRSEEELVERQFVAIYEGTREAAVWDITAEAYTPVEPDVWEMARVINDAYPFEYRNTATEGVTLYDNYLLPGDAQDGPDAVYKVTFDQDVMLNGTVTTVGTDEMAENAKMAVYTQAGIDEVGGPDLENNYVGPTIGNGGSSMTEYTAYPEGTETIGTLPMYGLYADAYTRSQYVIPATEIAPMIGRTINSLTYYASSTPEPWTGASFQVYLAEVSSTGVSSFIDPATATTVYSGVLTVVDNQMVVNFTTPYQYNGGNLLIGMDCTTPGTYHSCYFQCVPMTGAGMYAYNYSAPTFTSPYTVNYAPTTTFGLARGNNNRTEYIIENMTMVPGTYYIAASSTEDAWDVVLNAEELPCPEAAYQPTPADDADELEPAAVTLRWKLGEYTTEYRLVFGSTYYCEDVLVDWTTDLAESFTVTGLYNNTNYFWRVDVRNGNCETLGEVWGFTTHLNVPHNLSVADPYIFEGESAVLSWTAIQDRTYRYYNIYQDGELIGSTPANQVVTTYTVENLTYNMDGYAFYVTAVYDEGESAPSNEVKVLVSGNGNVAGHVYEMDGTTGIAGATVTFNGTDEFGDAQTFTFTTDANGEYTGEIMAGEFNGMASCTGYQSINEPVQGNPVAISHDVLTAPIDFVLDENFDPVCQVVAQYYPDSLNPASPYVKVYWGCGLPGGEIIEDFETGDFSKFDWQVSSNYPWEITTNNPYEGAYCMKSGGAGVANLVSDMSVTVNIPADGMMSFFSKISCESSWDYGYFYIDGVQMGSYTGAGTWGERTFNVTEGEHTFKWSYTKDGSINSNDDCFYVDYITFYRQPEPPVPGMTYDFEDGTMQGWTTIDADGDGRNFMIASSLLSGVAGHNGSADFVLSQSYDNSYGVLYPDNYLVSPQVELGGIVKFYACAQDASYAAEHFGLAVSTTTNNSASAFTTVQEWTMSAKSGQPTGKPVKGSRSGRDQGNWYEYTVDLSAYSGMGYVAIRHFNCSDQFYLDVDDITIGEASKGANDRAFSHYRVYRTNCYQESPYTEENTVVLACELQDTVYIDVSWPDADPGVYKYGVGVVYTGNRGQEIAGPIHWANVTRAKADVTKGNATFTDNKSAAAKGTRANELTVHDGTATDGYVPVYGLYCDAYLKCEYVMPAAELAPMAGSQITDMKFYINSPASGDWGIANFRVFMKEVSSATIDAFTGYADATVVYQGALDGSQETMDVHFNTPYNYNGGNLLIGFYNETIGTYHSASFIGEVVSGASVQGYNYNSLSAITPTQHDFLPKTTFTYQGGGSTHEPIQEPRESEIVWSNCIDKDMFMDNVDITVLLNSADSPEGTIVTLFNLNEAEADLYPVEPVILDETGFYAWDQFRRGEYAVNVALDGYEPIHDTVSIWDETHLRYVLTEILAPVSGDIYVSRTGWAMWDEIGPGPVPPVGGDEWEYSFDNGLDGWTTINANGDDHTWYHSNEAGNHSTLAITSHTGAGHMMSESYCNSTWLALNPDDYLVAPTQSAITNGSTFSFWACAQDENFAAEHFGVAISTTGNTNAADFTTINEWTLTAKGGSETNPAATRNGEGTRAGNWYNYSVDLSAYAGQNVWIAIRHFNCSDQFILCMDDAQLAIASKDGDRHFQYYKVMCTSIDGVPIFNHNTVYPFCQLDTNDPYQAPLVEGDHYLCKVAVMYSTGLSAWTEPVEWVYEPCEHWGPVDFVELVDSNEGNHIHWEFENGFNPYDPGHDTIPPTPQGQYMQYCTETFSGDVGTGGGEVWWAIKFPATSLASYVGQNITKLGVFTDVDGDFGWTYSGNYELSVYAGATAPTTFLSTVGNQYVAGDLAWHDFVLQDPVAITGAQDLWIVGHTLDIAYPMSGCDYVGEPNSDYLSLDGSIWEHAADYGLNYTWMLRAYVETGRGGIEAIESGMVGNTYAFNITDIANFDERVIFLHNLMNDSRFNVINGEAAGMFVISATDDNMDLEEAVNDFIFNNANEFAMMDKVQAAQVANAYKSTLPFNFVNSLMMDYYAASRDNNLCELAYPFCTDNGMYEFPAGVNAGNGETGPDYDCLYTTPNPAWYYMKIADPGDMDIYMYSTPSVDIDFCCWGPFDSPTGACPNGLTYDKVVSCSYSAQPTEHCMIPANAQTGEYYILVITNYSNQQCNINFSKVAGSGSTDCGIMPDVDIIGFLITIDGEYLDIVGPEVRDYTHEGEYGDHVYCVRPIYPGEQNLPDHNYGWSMGCPVCTTEECAAPSHLEGTYEWRNGQYGALISWVTDTRNIVSFNIYRSNDGVNYDKVGSIDGSKTEYFDAVEVGTYFYQVTAVSDCGESIPALTANGANFVIVTVTGIDENGGVAMYPNPTNGNVKIVANAMNHITVVSALGQVVYDMDVDCDEMNLNMAQFNAGIYTVRIATESGVSTQRLTVVR